MDAEFSIETFSKEGYGVGFFEDKKIKVAHAFPGDLIKAELCKKKKRGAYKGRLKEIVQPSSDRVAPKCKHANMCGGCKLSQFSYPAQLAYKEKLLKKTFSDFPEVKISPIIPSEEWGYRGKMEFTFSENRAGTKFLGLMIAAAGRYVFNVEECYLTSSWVAALLNQVRAFWEESSLHAFNPLLGKGFLRYLTFRETKRTGQKMVILTILDQNEEPFEEKDKQKFIEIVGAAASYQAVKKEVKEEAFEKEEPINFILRTQKSQKGVPTFFEEEVLLGKGFMEEELLIENKSTLSEKKDLLVTNSDQKIAKPMTIKFKISPASFFQPNPLQAEKLYSKALEIAEVNNEMRVLDLYAGSAALGMVFAPFVKEVTCIEENPAAVLDAQKNIALNNFSNISVYEGDVGKVLKELDVLKSPDLVIVDPPRAGLDPLALENIVSLAPQKILYISCNIETQQKNILELASKGYVLKVLQPVDQFPQTLHLENIALLNRKK